MDVHVLPGGAGYLRLSHFGGKASDELEQAVKRLRSDGARGVIVDLRNNPGGQVIAAVEVAQLFLSKNTVVFKTDGRKAEADTVYRAKRDGPFLDLPLVLLADRGTASAEEALAAALQDHKRARLVGRRTFGKALVQSPFFLKTGDVIWLTIARVFSPNGRMIQRDYASLSPESYRALTRTDTASGGVAPDVAVPAEDLPPWWTRAVANGLVYAVADSVAATLQPSPDARTQWIAMPAEWERRLLPPLLARVRQSAPGASGDLTDAMRTAVSRRLAARAAEVCWGADAAIELLLATDPDVRAAEAQLRTS